MKCKLALMLAAAIGAASVIGCQGEKKTAAVFDTSLAGQFFPLQPKAEWMYSIKSKSEQKNYAITDTVVGQKYVPSLDVTGLVVSEYYDLDRGGTRPIIYITKNGYLDRLSGLDYAKDEIQAPVWGRSDENEFLPQRLTPNLSWNSKYFPFGHMKGAFDIKESHKTFLESDEVVVPAGRFGNCIRVETAAVFEGGQYAGKDPSKITYEDWYAPKVGLIKTVTHEGGAGGDEMDRVELVHYQLPAGGAAQTATAHP